MAEIVESDRCGKLTDTSFVCIVVSTTKSINKTKNKKLIFLCTLQHVHLLLYIIMGINKSNLVSQLCTVLWRESLANQRWELTLTALTTCIVPVNCQGRQVIKALHRYRHFPCAVYTRRSKSMFLPRAGQASVSLSRGDAETRWTSLSYLNPDLSWFHFSVNLCVTFCPS